jgi:type II secretory ATPase GspE/PulE/Tfp pilus assembly ATPase PilB-like protein
LAGREIPEEIVRLFPARVAHQYRAVPLEWAGGRLVVAFPDPENFRKVDDLRLFLEKDILPVRSEEPDIAEALKAHYGVGAETLEGLSGEEKDSGEVRGIDDLESAEGFSIETFVKQLLGDALRSRATDIHLEPYPEALRIRRRIDGVLVDAPVPAAVKDFQSEIITRIKVMADLDIAERRLPQDGRIKVRVGGGDLDLRVSVLPTAHGESLTVRFLTGQAYLDLERLGFLKEDGAYLESLLRKPHGIVLLTGPTGSGKTTTLYCLLNKLNRSENKIITIEDPVEYQIAGITQVQVQPKIGLSFAAGLRSMLRHDPDVMMVGEIRDLETAEIAIRVSLTGHLVFSTLHTNDAAGAVTRLLDMGLEPFLVASSLECVIAQRLVRVLCPICRKMNPDGVGAKVCRECGGTGYRGRTVIYEILPVDRSVRDLILRRASADEIRRHAVSRGMKGLRECGQRKAESGVTSSEEVFRTTLKEDSGDE